MYTRSNVIVCNNVLRNETGGQSGFYIFRGTHYQKDKTVE